MSERQSRAGERTSESYHSLGGGPKAGGCDAPGLSYGGASPRMPPMWLASALVLLGSGVAGQVYVRPPVAELNYDTDVRTRRFDVLDVDFEQGRVLFRHVYRLVGDEARGLAPGVDCHYEGLEEGDGEVLGIYDLRRDRYDTVFPVKAPVRSAEACSSPEEIELTLKTAREQVVRFGLALEGRPEGYPPSPQGDYFAVPVKGHSRPVRLDAEARRATATDLEGEPDLGAGGPAVALARLEAQGRILYTRYQVIDSEAQVGREITFLRLYLSEDGRKGVLLERFYHRPPTGTPRSLFSFSPVLDLESLLTDVEELPEDEVVKDSGRTPRDVGAKKPVTQGPQDEGTCTDSCCSCGCMACVAPALGGACGCMLCVDTCSSLERKLFRGGDEVPPPPPPDERDDDDDGGGDKTIRHDTYFY